MLRALVQGEAADVMVKEMRELAKARGVPSSGESIHGVGMCWAGLLMGCGAMVGLPQCGLGEGEGSTWQGGTKHPLPSWRAFSIGHKQ